MRAYYDAELPTRTDPSTNSHRSVHLRDFVDTCRTWHLESVLEVGCGAGHDGRLIRAAGLAYTGVDLSAVGVGLCAGLSLHAVQASAINLPFRNRSFDAGWTMSTHMHLPGNDINVALTELGRVIRPGGLLEVGVWGADKLHTRIDDHGRYFRLRTDDQLQELLSGIGQVVAFETWDRFPDTDGHYQWARVQVGDEKEQPTDGNA
jgi:SAM-dependent methyltransferase